MRVLLLVASAAVTGLLWPREESRVRCARAVTARPVAPAALAPPCAAAPAPEATEPPTPERPSGVAKGPCALHLRLVDDATGEGLHSWVELWRLCIPETAEWTAGDQLQATECVGGHGHVFRDLPPGRYRVLVYDQRSVVEDPPAFDVEGEATERTVFVAAPRTYRAHLRVFAQTGAMVPRARLCCGMGGSTRRSSQPDWARPRHFKNGGYQRRRGARCSIGLGARSRLAICADQGFELCAFREDGRRTTWYRHVQLSPPERSRVEVRVTGDRTADRTYVGVAVSLELLRGLVLLPGGGLARDAGASFDASSDAIPADAAESWRSIPVVVTVRLDGYEERTFTYRVDRPPPMQVMRPEPASEPR